jgi:ferredoxin
MADLNQRTAKNAPGKFYVDNHCLAHDVCRQLAPKNFAYDEENGCFYVCKQPDSPEELAQCLEAMAACPMAAIGNDGLTVGELTSVGNGPERNVEIVVTPREIRSEISKPSGSYNPQDIDRYEVSGLRPDQEGLLTLAIVLKDGRRIDFYRTYSKLDLVLLLDQLDGTIGDRPRHLVGS